MEHRGIEDLKTERSTNMKPTISQIMNLRAAAGNARDYAMVDICNHALGGDEKAIRTCAEVIEDARVQSREPVQPA